MESREGVQQIALIELQRVVAADQEFRRSDDVFAVDNAEKAHLWMADEIIEDSGHHHGVTRVQHIDSHHSRGCLTNDLELVHPILHLDGIICLDDIERTARLPGQACLAGRAP